MLCMKDVFHGEHRALQLYQKALAIDNQDFVVHYNMVLCYIRNNQAIEKLNAALGLLDEEIERLKLLQIHL